MMSRSHQRAAVAASVRPAALACMLVLLAGCTSGTGTKARSSNPATDQTRYTQGLGTLPARTRLETLAEREALDPSDPSRELANRMLGGQIEMLRPGSARFNDAHRSSEEIIDAAVARYESLHNIDDAGEIPLLPQIAKGYVRARAAMLEDDTEQAIAIFEQLHRASPGSPEILIGLGDAYMRRGDRGQAIAAYKQAIELGDRTMHAMVYSAMNASDDPELVIELTATIWSMDTSTDRAGRLLGGVMLGQALIETGKLRAGAEIMTEAMGMLDGDTARDPRYRRELVQLYTKRTEQYASIGDAWLMLDRPERALELYDQARGLVTSEPQELTARRIAAYLMNGHSAMGALALLDWIDANPGNDSGELERIVGIVASHPMVGPMVFDSLLASTQDTNRPVSHRRAVLGMLLGLRHDDAPGSAAMLAQTDPGVISPVACARVLDLFDGRQAKLDAAMGIVDRSPSIAPIVIPALIRLDGSPLEIMGLIKADSASAQLVRCLIAMELEHPSMIGDVLDAVESGAIDQNSQSTTWLISHARASAMAARWELSRSLFDSCDQRAESMNVAELFFYTDSLVSANDAQQAMATVDARVWNPDVSAAEWLVNARVAQMLGDPELLLESLTRAIDLDPYDEAIYERLVTLRGSTGALPDTDELRSVTRSLGQRLPNSALVGLIRAHELAGAGANAAKDEAGGPQAMALLAQSERLLYETHTQHPWREIGLDLLLSIWATQSAQGDATAIARGIAWLDGQLAMMPGSLDLIGAKARLMVLDGDEQGAESYLASLYDRYPSRSVGRLHEGLIRSDETRRAEADALALDRLDGLVSVADCIERLERAGAAERLTDFAPEELVPDQGAGTLAMGMTLRIVRVLGAVAQSSVDPATNALVIDLAERARAISAPVDQASSGSTGEGEIDPLAALDQIETVARASAPGFLMDDYEAFLRHSISDGSTSAGNRGLVGVAVQSLMRARSTSAAMDLLARMSINPDGTLDHDRVMELVSLLGQIGSADDLTRSVSRIESAGLLVEARDTVSSSLGTIRKESWADRSDASGVRADLMYSVAVLASFYEREPDSTAMYHAVLASDPNHAWANNDLGYQMAERGEDLEEAERLLMLAHQQEPEAASITDSLAWARYAMGILDDEIDGSGAVIRRGARGLLESALTMNEGASNATIHDHLGDTLWMLSEFKAAIGAWLDAEDRLRARLTELAAQPNANPAALESIREELSTIRFKIADAESGRVPAVGKTAVGLEVPSSNTIQERK